MSSNLIRTKEATIQVTIDGVRQPWSRDIKDLSIKPDVERMRTRHVGQARAAGDIDIKGYEVTFKCNRSNHGWMDVIERVQRADRNGDVLPVISIAITYAYRDGQTRTVTLSGGRDLFPDDLGIPESGYLEDSWSGFFPEMN